MGQEVQPEGAERKDGTAVGDGEGRHNSLGNVMLYVEMAVNGGLDKSAKLMITQNNARVSGLLSILRPPPLIDLACLFFVLSMTNGQRQSYYTRLVPRHVQLLSIPLPYAITRVSASVPLTR